jgi:hypothetical protein
MIEKIKGSFDSGVEKIRWFSSLLSDRIKVEAAVVKLMSESNTLEKRRDELVRTIGERVFELRGVEDINALADGRIRKALAELEVLDSELRELKEKASQISSAD